MTREEIEQKMDELGRRYVETHDSGLIEELYEFARELKRLEEESWKLKTQALNALATSR